MESREAGQGCRQGHDWEKSQVVGLDYCSRNECKAIRDHAVIAQIQLDFGVTVHTTATGYHYSLRGLSLGEIKAINKMLESLITYLTPYEASNKNGGI